MEPAVLTLVHSKPARRRHLNHPGRSRAPTTPERSDSSCVLVPKQQVAVAISSTASLLVAAEAGVELNSKTAKTAGIAR